MSQYPTVGMWPNNNAGRYGVGRCTRLPYLNDHSSHCFTCCYVAFSLLSEPWSSSTVRCLYKWTNNLAAVQLLCINNIVVGILITALEEALNAVKMMRLAITVFLCSLTIAGNSRTHRSICRDICLTHCYSKCIHVYRQWRCRNLTF